jgi:hypothetical protein
MLSKKLATSAIQVIVRTPGTERSMSLYDYVTQRYIPPINEFISETKKG